MTLPEMRDHIVETLNGQAFSMPFTAEPAYNPKVLDLIETPLEVFVIPGEISSEVNDETAWGTTIGVDIAVTGKLPKRGLRKGTEDVPDIDPYLQLCAELVSFFKSSDYEPSEGFRVEAVNNSPAYDAQALKAGRFISPIQILLFAAIEE